MIWFNLKQVIPFFPLSQMIRVQLEYGIINPNKWHIIFIWVIKLILLEPFRIIESIVMVILPEKKINPLFILGYYRSGTTYLQELLSANKEHTTLTLFHSVLPEISLCFHWLFIPILSITSKLFKVQNHYHNVPLDFNFPGEEDVALNSLMAYYDYNRIFQYPSHYEKINKRILISPSEKTTRSWMANYKYLMKKIAYTSGDKRIILKSPPNMARTPILQKMYPDALFVFIHRNPLECIHSAKRIWKLNQPYSFESYSETVVKEIIENQYATFYYNFKINIKKNINCTVKFEDLVTQPEKTIELIYSKLSLHLNKTSRIKTYSLIKKDKKSYNIKEKYLNNFEIIKNICLELGYN